MFDQTNNQAGPNNMAPLNLPQGNQQPQGNEQYAQQFYDPTQPASNPSGRISTGVGGGGNFNSAKSNYARELQEQIRRKQEQKYQEMVNDRQAGMQHVRSRVENDPFGRQGAGAPLRDIFGNIITTKNKALSNLYQYPSPNQGQQNPQIGAEPTFSLKARLARENFVSQSVGDLRGAMQGGQPQGYPQEQGYNQNMGNFYAQQMYPGQEQYNPNPYGQMQQQHGDPYQQMPPEGNPLMGYINTPMTQRKRNDDVPVPYPQPNEKAEDKQKRIYAHLSLQNDLLKQMEEKKMKKAQEEAKKKMEEELEEMRVRKENEMIRMRDEQEAQKKKQKFQDFQNENGQLAKGVTIGVDVVQTKKEKGKRARTPIEEVLTEVRKEIYKTTEQTNVNVQEAPFGDFPKEFGRHLQHSIEGQLSDLKREWEGQQINLHHQLLDLKTQLHNANQARVAAHDEIGELKHNLRNQQIAEEIRRTQLYNALLKGQSLFQQPQVVQTTITRLEHDREIDPFEFPKNPTRGLYKMNEEDEDSLDAMLAAQSKIISGPNVQFGTHGRFIERPFSTQSAMDGSHMGLNYLNYYNGHEDHTAIRLDGGYSLPDDYTLGGTQRFSVDDDDRGTVGEIYRKNKERLEVLEDLEYKGVDAFETRREPAKRYAGVDDEIYQMMKDKDHEDDLLEQINNPRKYHGDDYDDY